MLIETPSPITSTPLTSADPGSSAAPRSHRIDHPRLNPFNLDQDQVLSWSLIGALAIGFVAIGGGVLDLGASEARLGLAAWGQFGPFGQTFGYWAYDLWPVPVLASQVWASLQDNGHATTAAVRWPAAIAGIVLGLVVASRLITTLKPRIGLLFALCWFGSLAMIDRSSSTELDLFLGLATVGTLDRMLSKGSDWIAGLWAAFAFLAGGWPPLVMIAMTIIVLGKSSASFSLKLLLPPAVAAIAWSTWALSVAPVDAWASALTFPLIQKPAWLLTISVLAIGLPWTPFAALASATSVRAQYTPAGRNLVKAWLQISLAALIAGSIVPGLAPAARVPALVGLLIATATVLDVAWAGGLTGWPQRIFFGGSLAIVLAWLAVGFVAGLHLSFNVPYYRAVGILLLVGLIPIVSLGFIGFEYRDARQILAALAIVAISVKVGHAGCYAPEWNYRFSQGPWGRALGQWVMPKSSLYVFHDWSPDLAFAVGRPIRQLRTPQHLAFEEPDISKFVLLQESEFRNWPSDAPALIKLSQFHDEVGDIRVMARTHGYLPQPFGTRDATAEK